MASNSGLMGIVTCQPQTDIGRRMLSPDIRYFHLTNYSSIQVDSSGGEVQTVWAVVVFLSPSLV